MILLTRRFLATLLTLAVVFPAFAESKASSTNPTAINDPVTVTYDYDAFGNLIHSTGTTPNNYLYSGEQFDPDLGLYYNRARYLNTSTGRFWNMDTFEGDSELGDRRDVFQTFVSRKGQRSVGLRSPSAISFDPALPHSSKIPDVSVELFVTEEAARLCTGPRSAEP